MVESWPMQLSTMQQTDVAANPVYYPKDVGLAAYAKMPVSERCVPEFEMQAATMDKQLEELHKFVEALEIKLDPVLKPSVPTPDRGAGQAPDSTVAPIADYLRTKNRTLRSALDKLSYLLNDRVDL